MARKGTTRLNLGTWTDRENPGAGSQDVDNTSLNGNWIKIDAALGSGHNADGTHKDGVIDAVNLKSTVADGLTLVQDESTKKLKVNSAGIGTAQLGDSSVTTVKLNNGAVTTAKLAASAVTPNELADNAVSTVKLQDGAVSGVKIADGAITAEKLASGATAGSGYILYGDTRIAGSDAGASAPAATEWQEISLQPVVKLSTFFRPRPGDRYLRLIASAKTLNSKGWKVELNCGGYSSTTVSAVGFNTAYNTTTQEVALQIEITTEGMPDVAVEVQVKLAVNGTVNTASMTNVVLMVTPN